MNKSLNQNFRKNIIMLSIIITVIFLVINIALYVINDNYLVNKIKEENAAFLKITTHIINDNELPVALEYILHYTHINEVEVEIVDEDNNHNSISWICCCSGNTRSDSELFNKCLRHIIRNQIYEFKNKNNTSICSLCKKHSDNIHIDHYETTFKDIVKNFLIKFKLQIPTAFEKDNYNNVLMIGDDRYIGEVFEKYHQEVASYRILCAKCNLGRSKDGTDIEVYDVEEKKGNVFYMKEYVIDLD